MPQAARFTTADTADTETILVIEPDVLVRAVIADYLRGCGYKVIEGVSADDAFAVLKAGVTIHIVFSEVDLPEGIDGFKLAHRIRDMYPEVDVILTSGVAAAASKATEICDHGAITKPYHPEDLLLQIQHLRKQKR